MTKTNKREAIVVFVVAVVFLLIAVLVWRKTVYYRGEGVHADAEIVDIETTYLDDDTDHEVTVRFTTADGREITGKLDAYQSGFYVGKTVPVLYLPDDPRKFTYEKNGLLLPLILGGVGVLLLAVGICALARRERGYDDGSGCDGDAGPSQRV